MTFKRVSHSSASGTHRGDR